MGIINDLLKEGEMSGKTISIITIEGPASYKNTGKIIKLEDEEVLIEKENGRKMGIKIKSIVKVEE